MLNGSSSDLSLEGEGEGETLIPWMTSCSGENKDTRDSEWVKMGQYYLFTQRFETFF